MKYTIVLGSSSPIKVDAVANAVKHLGLHAEIQGHALKTSCNEQPVGFDETYTGAYSRAAQAREYANRNVSGLSIAIGIENGIFKMSHEGRSIVPSTTVDLAIIIVFVSYSPHPIVVTSQGIQFPNIYVGEAEKKGFATTTVGQIIAEKFGGDASDPHTYLTEGKVVRQRLLVDALILALDQLDLEP